MQSIYQTDISNLHNVWLLVSDVDDTLLGDNSALRTFAQALQVEKRRIIFILNSSRPCASLHQSIQQNPLIPQPDYLIGALGTEIEIAKSGQLIKDYAATIMSEWDRDQVEGLMKELKLQAHADEFQTPFKASYRIDGKEHYQIVLKQLEQHNLKVKVIFSGGTNLDIIPQLAGKGTAIRYMQTLLGISDNQVVAAGDSANDLDMFYPPNKAIIVANAEAALRSLQGEHIYHARSEHAAGLLEGLYYWGVLT